MIYLNSIETTTPKPEPVIKAVVRAMTTMGNASRGTHGDALEASQIVYRTRQKLANLFGCPKADHVAFASSGTEALNIAIRGTLCEPCHVIVMSNSACEIIDSINRDYQMAPITYDRIPDDTDWKNIHHTIAGKVRPDTKAIICSHDCSLTGNIFDLRQIGKLARDKHLLFITDASRTAGLFPIHMEEMLIDVLCFSGHKYLMGPQGTGGLCIRPDVEIRPFKVGGSGVQSYSKTQPVEYPARLEAGTLNSHGIAGLSAALDYLEATDMDPIRQKMLDLMYRFYHGIAQSDHIIVYGNFYSVPRIPAVTLNIQGIRPEMLAEQLQKYHGIKASVIYGALGHATSTAIDSAAVNFSFSYFNTETEVDDTIRALLAIARQ